MPTVTRKPFYSRPPWNILFEFHKLEKLTPWKINIAYLLTSFLSEMEKNGEVDFRASGVALDSSALIYLMKSKLLLELEEPLQPPRPSKDFIPPPLFLPLRHELTSTTIRQLLAVLDDVLKGEKFMPKEKTATDPVLPTPSEVLPQLDLYLMEVELQMNELHASLLRKVNGTGIVQFSILVRGMKRLAVIRIFILLLFLAQDSRVRLWQDEKSEEIYIGIGNLTSGENAKTGI